MRWSPPKSTSGASQSPLQPSLIPTVSYARDDHSDRQEDARSQSNPDRILRDRKHEYPQKHAPDKAKRRAIIAVRFYHLAILTTHACCCEQSARIAAEEAHVPSKMRVEFDNLTSRRALRPCATHQKRLKPRHNARCDKALLVPPHGLEP